MKLILPVFECEFQERAGCSKRTTSFEGPKGEYSNARCVFRRGK
jgi:hypothetical protein